MSNPSFENIDQWLFEYMEGNLSPAQVAQLETFMLNNPEFDADMDAWQLAKVDASPVVYPGVAGRQRKPIPFWVSATAVLSAVFVAGGLFGAYIASSDSSDELVANIEVATSAASRMEYRLHSSNLSTGLVDENQRSSNENVVSNVIPSNVTPVKVEKFNGASKKASQLYSLSNSRPVKVSQSLAEPLGIKEGVRDFSKDYSTELTLDDGQGMTKIGETSNKDKFKNSNKDELAENVERNSNSVPKSDEADPNHVNDDRSRTAEAMTRGGDKISSNYNASFSKKVKSVMRKIARMTDNPIALTNSKDIYYHVPGMQTLNVNAATAGNLLRPRIQATTRAQWIGHSNQQLMNELSFDTYVRSIRGGIGVQLNHSYYNEGTYNVGQIALTYSPKLTVNRNFSIEPAVRFKMGDKRLNSIKLVPGQIIEMDRGNEKIFLNETPENLVKDLWYKDIALAINSNTKWFSAGFQVDNLGRHNSNAYNSSEESIRSGMHYTANLGTDFVSRSKIISFSPYLMYQKVENLSEIWGGSIFRYKNLTVGGAYSSAGDYAGSIGLKTKSFMLTYNADMTKSNLTDSRLFSQQVTMRILMNKGRYGR